MLTGMPRLSRYVLNSSEVELSLSKIKEVPSDNCCVVIVRIGVDLLA
jgi:hypothetical protein